MNAITTPIADACCSSCGAAAAKEQDTAPAIACTLGSGDFKERVSTIRDLAKRSLRASKREPLKLILTYGPEALNEVEDLVAQESECCAFLDFELRQNMDGVHLIITTPLSARSAADELFGHFSPELAQVVA